LSVEEERLINQYLDEAGKFLFFQMNRVDQCHALSVAKTLLKTAGYQDGIDLKLLVTAGLLHDVGKVEGDLNFWSRIAAGLVRRIKPAWREKYGREGQNNFWSRICHGFYVDLVHPARGSYMAQSLGIEKGVVELIRHHHDPLVQGQSRELAWLQAADNKN